MPQKEKETLRAMPGCALWDSRPVVPRDWGPLAAVAEDGGGEALLENRTVHPQGSNIIHWYTGEGKLV